MVHIIKENRKPSMGERLSAGVGRGLDIGSQIFQQNAMQKQKQQQSQMMAQAGQKLLGMDISSFDPDTQKALLVEGLKQQGKGSQQKTLMDFVNQTQGSGEDSDMEQEPSSFQDQVMRSGEQSEAPQQQETFQDEIIEKPRKSPKPKKYSEKAIVATSAMPGGAATAREMRAHNDAVDKKELAKTKSQETETRRLQAETAPRKQEIIQRANLSREAIQNKNRLMSLIDQGNLDDPTFAAFAMNLPFNLGKRLLSDDTVEYKGGLVDEFGDLKNIFKGATRVKEVEIYEDKLPDIYLTDSQKKAILKSRVNTAKIDLLREEAAEEVERKYPNLSALQYNKKVEELMEPKMNALFNTIWDQQKSVINDAENRKKMPLDPSDPEDKKIMQQIFKDAGGNITKAKKLAKEKGYTVKGVP